MTEYLTDEEQVERIKKWWSDNGSSVVAGLAIGLGGLFGWRYWVDYQDNVSAQASAHFSRVTLSLEAGQYDRVIEQANIILSDYSSTAYADLAHLSLAKAFVEAKEYGKAEQQLKMIIDSRADNGLEMIARKRLAAILYQKSDYKQALTALEVSYPTQFAAAFEEMKGDILVAMGEEQKAREAYQRAQLAQPSSPDPQFLQQKLEDLGIAETNS